jgi:hypothetical protein
VAESLYTLGRMKRLQEEHEAAQPLLERAVRFASGASAPRTAPGRGAGRAVRCSLPWTLRRSTRPPRAGRCD